MTEVAQTRDGLGIAGGNGKLMKWNTQTFAGHSSKLFSMLRVWNTWQFIVRFLNWPDG